MYIRWKVLLSLGVIFWLALCISDYFHMQQTDLFQKYVIQYEPEVIPEPQPEMIVEEKQLDEYNFTFTDTLYWCIVAFLSSVLICLIGQQTCTKIRQYMRRNSEIIIESAQIIPICRSSSISKIPILIQRKSGSCIEIQSPQTMIDSSHSVFEELNQSCPNLIPNKSSEIKAENTKKSKDLHAAESACKLRDEITAIQANSMREQALLSRKLEAILREKRELSEALACSQKENRSAKQKLDTIQKERGELLKQLDSAAYEIKANTNSKQLTLSRFEQAVSESKEMKEKFSKLYEEKQQLETKVMLLDKECRGLKERKVELNKSYGAIKLEAENELDKTDDEGSVITLTLSASKESNVYDPSQSEIDMKKVQTKLQSLEISLNKLKFASALNADTLSNNSKDSMEMQLSQSDMQHINETLLMASSTSSIDELPTRESICTSPACKLDHHQCTRPECFLHKPAAKTLRDNASSPVVRSITSNLFTSLAEKTKAYFSTTTIRDVSCSDVVSIIRNADGKDDKEEEFDEDCLLDDSLSFGVDSSVRPTISDDRLSVMSDDNISVKTEFDEYYAEVWSAVEPKRMTGIVSKSPDFQRFLQKMLMEERQGMMHVQNILVGDGII